MSSTRNNWSKKFLTIGVLALVVLVAFAALRIYNLTSLVDLQEKVISRQEETLGKVEDRTSLISSELENVYKMNGSVLEDFPLVESVASGRNMQNLSSMVEEDMLLILFSENTCMSCIDEQIRIIQELEKKVDPENILILFNFSNFRKFQLYTSKFDLRSRTANLAERSEAFNRIAINPAVILVDTSLKVKQFFRPQEGESLFNRACYSNIINNGFELREGIRL